MSYLSNFGFAIVAGLNFLSGALNASNNKKKLHEKQFHILTLLT
jgi:hypothetical protein